MVEFDAALQTLHDRKDDWARLPVKSKVAYLLSVRDLAHAHAAHWVEAAADAKRIPRGSPWVGEEWISGPWALLYALNRYVATLRQISHAGAAHFPRERLCVRDDGRLVARVFPSTIYDRLLLGGVSADVWMQSGVTPENLDETMAAFYRDPSPRGRVALVLGAGNISSIAPLDVLYKLIAGGAACMLKMNPVNEYLEPILADVFEPFVSAGFLRFARGGSDAGRYLCNHRLVDEIHVTGSVRTYAAITDQLTEPKPMTSELGNVSPTIVVPGSWSEAGFRYQAENIVTQRFHNAGFSCCAAQVLVLPASWAGTPRLLEAIAQVLRSLPPRVSYYPGSIERQRSLVAAHPGAAQFGTAGDGIVPRALVRVNPDDPDDPVLRDEAFCGVLAHVELPGDSRSFLRAAATFANDQLWGTLGANVIVDPRANRAMPAEVDRLIADLRYGCIGVNAWTGVGYLLAETPWGAYPGSTPLDIQSGTGVVHNAHLFGAPEKSVVRAPFVSFPKPPWFVTSRSADTIGRMLCDFEVRKTPLRAAAIAGAALRA